jgi:hypothetical protein
MFQNFFESINDLYCVPHELAAIWLSKPVITSTGKTVRIAPEQLICVVDNEIKQEGELTHKIIGCYGTLINQFEVSVMEIKTNEISILKL